MTSIEYGMNAAGISMREKIDIEIGDGNCVIVSIKGVRQTLTRNEFGEFVCRCINMDNFLDGDAP